MITSTFKKILHAIKRLFYHKKIETIRSESKPIKEEAPKETKVKGLVKPHVEEDLKKAPPKRDVHKRTQRRPRKKKPPVKRRKGKQQGTDTRYIKEGYSKVRIRTPYIELNIDKGKVFLIIPEQKIESKAVNNKTQLTYKLRLNNDTREEPATLLYDNTKFISSESKRIEVTLPLRNVKVTFPPELQGKIFHFNHPDTTFYIFRIIDSDRGRLYLLFDDEGRLKPIPRKKIWLLLHEAYEPLAEPLAIEETWIWENYKPYLLNLHGVNSLTIRKIDTNEEIQLPCKTIFRMEGETLIEDDFKEENPLFAGNTIKIKSSRKNPQGWIVWIQNDLMEPQVITEDWNGEKPLILNLPRDLPCECGQFQIDICKRNDQNPEETLFFRWLPSVLLEYPKEILIPGNSGHKTEIVKVHIPNIHKWSFKTEGFQTKLKGNMLSIEVPPNTDTLNITISKKGKPETRLRIQVTLKRLRWRMSDQEEWIDKPLKIRKKKLTHGRDLYLHIYICDKSNAYHLRAMLKDDNNNIHQQSDLNRYKDYYTLFLNKFFDTIKQYNNKLKLEVEIRKGVNGPIIGKVIPLYFPKKRKRKSKTKPKITVDKVKSTPESPPRILQPIPIVLSNRGKKRKGRGFSKSEIILADISLSEIHTLKIPYDKLRRSAHIWNIKTLVSLKKGGGNAD